MTTTFANKCFVCGIKLLDNIEKNKVTNLPICSKCKGTPKERVKEKEALDSLADGFVCGCI
ncbi:hypothetical protein E9993_01565 [Labilibacter sediminis]|nr:hypothetical protein E9993_01565 [Labilibacter sediminis]